jgi:hypothetical protein
VGYRAYDRTHLVLRRKDHVLGGVLAMDEAPKVAYLISSWHKLDQLERLADRILELSPRAEIVVHHDAKAPEMPWRGQSPDNRIHLVDRIPVQWGDWSQIQAFLMLIGFAYDVLQADWFCLLSGEDRPVIDLARWERDLPRAAFDALLPGGPLVRHAPFGRRPSFSEQSYVRYEYRWRRVPFPNLRHRTVHRVFLPFGWLRARRAIDRAIYPGVIV